MPETSPSTGIIVAVGQSRSDILERIERAGLPDGWRVCRDGIPSDLAGESVLILRALFDSPEIEQSHKAADAARKAKAGDVREHCPGLGWLEREPEPGDVARFWREAAPQAEPTAPAQQTQSSDAGDGLALDYIPIGKNGSATVTARLGHDVLAVEKIDFSRSKQRDAFAAKICDGRPGIDRAAIDTELLKLAAGLAARGSSDEDDVGDQPEPDHLASMTEAARAAGRAMLESPDLMKRIIDDIAAVGVAGERELAATLYLLGCSRLLPKPLAAIVQGPSSSGKSYLADKVAGLFPDETIVHATQMTPQALFHMQPGSLRHRWIVAGERSRKENDDTAEATRALREMIASGRLTKLMPMKVGGEIQTVPIVQDGPIAYSETTTLGQVFDEDANRSIMLTTDEQTAQTRRIIDRLAETYSGNGKGAAEAIIERHHAAQRMLSQHDVVIPFARRLGELLTPERVEARRAFPQLASMIQASALLHQLQRKIDTDGRLIATRDDYELSRHLLLKPLGRLLGGRLSDPAARFLERLRERFRGDETFTRREAACDESASRRAVEGWLSELHEAGLAEIVEPSRGRAPATWRVSEGSALADCPILPAADQVFIPGE